jgi:ferric-dicitrate binding protein FerR (iron transport regulator)
MNMEMDLKRINELIQKYADGTATEAEKTELTAWYREQAYHDAVFPGDENEVYQELFDRINGATGLKPIRTRWKGWAAAASVAILLGTGIGLYFFTYSGKQPTKQITGKLSGEPGSNSAILILSNGSQIVLSSAANGPIASQGNVSVTKTANGQLIYHINEGAEKQPAKNSVAYNTISTPAGGQYMVVLPDKTTVWLNAKSSLKFPVTFKNAKERYVELTGEAYFEVTHNEQMPFKVSTGKLITEDLGTAFNINAYSDEPGISTTLVNGAVRVTAGNSQVMLRPGEQAHYQEKMIVSRVNVDGVVAWKDGYFRFDDESLESIMRTMSRWYNVSYVFEDEDLRKETFGVMANRAGNISALLSLLEKTGPARFRLEGTTIMISHKN